MKFKNSLCVCALTATLGSPLQGQEPVAPPPDDVTVPVLPVAPRATRAPREARFDELATDVATQARALAGQIGAEARVAAEHAKIAAMDLRRGFRRGDGNRTLVLPANGGRPESLAESHEDLSVMSRILNKAVEKESRRGASRGFVFSMGETGGNLDAMYLEGYGAVFLLNADFPLVAPQAKPTKAATKEDDSTWERAKREIRGQDLDDDTLSFGSSGVGWTAEEDQPKYDGERVDGLKRRLTESLKHAKNLRGLRDGEHVTVIVFGKSVGKRSHAGRVVKLADVSLANEDELPAGKGGQPNIIGYVNTDAVRQSTLVIRAKKSDITRFAAGEIKSDEFMRAVSVSAF